MKSEPVDIRSRDPHVSAMLTVKQTGDLASMAFLEHIVYPPPQKGYPHLVVELVRLRTRDEISKTFVAATKAEADQICQEQQEIWAVQEADVVPPTERKSRTPKLSPGGKWILTPKGDVNG